MENKISATVTPEDLAELKQDVEKIKAKFPWLINLSSDDKSTGFYLGEKSLPFISKVSEYFETHPEYIPHYVSIDEFRKDLKLWNDINTMMRTVNILTDSLEDTADQAGFEAMEAALAYYAMVREAAKRNAPGAKTIYEELSSRFVGRPSSKKQAASSN